jgi:hypothetical protein
VLGGNPATPAETPEAVTISKTPTDSGVTTPAPTAERTASRPTTTTTHSNETDRPLAAEVALRDPLALPAVPFNATLHTRYRATTPNRSLDMERTLVATVASNGTIVNRTEIIRIEGGGGETETYRYHTVTAIRNGTATQQLVFDRPSGTETRTRTFGNTTGRAFVRSALTTELRADRLAGFQAVQTTYDSTPPQAVYRIRTLSGDADVPRMPDTTFELSEYNGTLTTTPAAVAELDTLARYNRIDRQTGERRQGQALVTTRYRTGLNASQPDWPSWAK